MGKDQEREQRLAEALRANLKRRKQQQRGAAPAPAEGRVNPEVEQEPRS